MKICSRKKQWRDMDKIENRGGARAGAGRKSASQEEKRVQVSISVSPETMTMIQDMRRRKVKVGKVVDDMIHDYFAKAK